MVNKTELLALLHMLVEMIIRADTVAECTFKVDVETTEMPTHTWCANVPNGWKTLELKIRWFSRTENFTKTKEAGDDQPAP